jgi:hypothetical protein
MLQLPREQKLQLFSLIKSQPDAFGETGGRNDLINFLERIWDLRSMPSEDPRFSDARGDAIQHLINNNDWDYDYVFLDRFKLLDSEEKFNLFIEVVVSPAVRQNEDEIIRFILLIEPFIVKHNYFFAVDDYSASSLPIYKLRENKDGADFLFDLKPNTIPFVVEWNKTGRSNMASSHKRPTKFPSFVLVFNDGWNDYNTKSLFDLFYYSEVGSVTRIGEIKIISNTDSINIEDDLDDEFTELDLSFCSLGQTIGFYQALKATIGKDYESVLYALRDAALFPDNHDRFEKNNKFINSLIRFDVAEQVLRTARYISYGYDLQNIYTFSYSFLPSYSQDPIQVEFEFSKKGVSGNRIYAIIGKNGTGKTQLITSLPLDISRKKEDRFVPRAPFFSKVIAVSYSIFDQFEIPKKSTSFNYVYCGLKKSGEEQFTERGLALRFYSSWRKIQSQGRLESWKRVLSNFIGLNEIDSFIVPGNISSGEQAFKVDPTLFQETKRKFSSGQSIVFYIITEIVANIRYDSLLLYDEPETHLHPNAITELIYLIHELVNEFQSYCIIATHSPVIIRELFSKNVYVLDRTEDIPTIRPIGIESFGEDIGVLTDEVFGNKEVPKQYKKIIDDLAFARNSFDQIVERLESDNFPLSLNARLYIRSAVKQNNG